MTQQEKLLASEMRKAGKAISEIAKELSLSVNTVKSALRRESIKETSAYSVCKQCGNRIANTPHKKAHLFCSAKCRYSWWNQHRNSESIKSGITCKCAACGKVFTAYEKKHRKYCSRECYIKARYGAGERDD